jgi:copper chaperone CopZ
MEVLRLDVEGMSCGACVLSVEKALQAVPGVRKVVVSLEARQAEVQGAGLEAGRLVAAVEDAGFEARARA